MTKRRTVIVWYSDCCKRTIIEEIEKKGLKKGILLWRYGYLQKQIILEPLMP